MGRSLGFGSTRGDYGALFRLAFAAAPSFTDLTSPPTSNSPAHSSKGTPSGYLVPEGSRQHPLTACRHSVSGTISLPSRGAFHLSLTVLVHYRSPGVFSLGGWSPRVPAEFHVSRGTQAVRPGSLNDVAYGALTVSGLPFQGSSAIDEICDFPTGPPPGPTAAYDPACATPEGYHTQAV